MKSQIKIRGNSRNILVVLLAAIIMLFAFLVILPVVPESTHADEDEPAAGISISVSDSLSIKALLKEGGDFKISKTTVSVSTSAAYGYELYLGTDSEAHQTLYPDGDSSKKSKISPVSGIYESASALSDNTWGYAIADQGSFNSARFYESYVQTSRFAAVPTIDYGQVIYSNDAAANDNVDVYYGVKINQDLEPGEYKTGVTYTAVARNIAPLKPQAILGTNNNLSFIYDRNTYNVGDTYTDNLGSTTISKVYTVPKVSIQTQKPAWTNNSNIITANFEQSFYEFKPKTTAYWFYENKYLKTITNAKNLNMSNVTDINHMFQDAGYENTSPFSLSLGDWDTSNVTDMSYTFFLSGFNSSAYTIEGLDKWNTSKVTNIAHMFDATGGNKAGSWTIGDISGWDVSKVTNMNGVFDGAGVKSSTWQVNLSNWKVGNVTNMSYMFSFAGYSATNWSVGDLSNWDVSNVTNMDSLFNSFGIKSPSWDIGNLDDWNVSNVTNMRYMFAGTGWNGTSVSTSWNIGDISGWDTGKVTDMSHMFYGASYNTPTWNIDLSKWNVSNVVDMSYMFNAAGYNATSWSIGNLNYVDEKHPGWDLKSVTNVSYMFGNAGFNVANFNLDIHTWRFSKPTNAKGMFSRAGYNSTTFTPNINGWDTKNITDMSSMFYQAGYSVTQTFSLDLSGWNVGSVTDMSFMFYQAGYNATNWSIGDISGWRVEQITTARGHRNFMVLHENNNNATTYNNQPHWNV